MGVAIPTDAVVPVILDAEGELVKNIQTSSKPLRQSTLWALT